LHTNARRPADGRGPSRFEPRALCGGAWPGTKGGVPRFPIGRCRETLGSAPFRRLAELVGFGNRGMRDCATPNSTRLPPGRTTPAGNGPISLRSEPRVFHAAHTSGTDHDPVRNRKSGWRAQGLIDHTEPLAHLHKTLQCRGIGIGVQFKVQRNICEADRHCAVDAKRAAGIPVALRYMATTGSRPKSLPTKPRIATESYSRNAMDLEEKELNMRRDRRGPFPRHLLNPKRMRY